MLRKSLKQIAWFLNFYQYLTLNIKLWGNKSKNVICYLHRAFYNGLWATEILAPTKDTTRKTEARAKHFSLRSDIEAKKFTCNDAGSLIYRKARII